MAGLGLPAQPSGTIGLGFTRPMQSTGDTGEGPNEKES
jgi:hypothetical protein